MNMIILCKNETEQTVRSYICGNCLRNPKNTIPRAGQIWEHYPISLRINYKTMATIGASCEYKLENVDGED